jgi:hypothetical protein
MHLVKSLVLPFALLLCTSLLAHNEQQHCGQRWRAHAGRDGRDRGILAWFVPHLPGGAVGDGDHVRRANRQSHIGEWEAFFRLHAFEVCTEVPPGTVCRG